MVSLDSKVTHDDTLMALPMVTKVVENEITEIRTRTKLADERKRLNCTDF